MEMISSEIRHKRRNKKSVYVFGDEHSKSTPIATDQSRAWVAIREALAKFEPIKATVAMELRHNLGVHRSNAHRMGRPTGHNINLRIRQESKIARKQAKAAQ